MKQSMIECFDIGDYNPRYAAYCKAHGKTLWDMMEWDESAWPGGCMCGFTLWIQRKSKEFKETHPLDTIGYFIANQHAFTAFLFAQPPERWCQHCGRFTDDYTFECKTCKDLLYSYQGD